MTAVGRALMARPSMILLDEPSMGLAPQIVEEIFEIVRDLNKNEKVSFLLAEQNTNVALRFADYGYILENGRVVMDGPAADLASNEDVKEFYLGLSTAGRKSFRDVKHYRRRKRWLGLNHSPRRPLAEPSMGDSGDRSKLCVRSPLTLCVPVQVFMTDFYDDLETRDPEQRERALLSALPGQVRHAKANAAYFARLLRDVDPNAIAIARRWPDCRSRASPI